MPKFFYLFIFLDLCFCYIIYMTVHTIILNNTWLIVSFVFQASLDEPTQTVIMHRTEPSRLQSLALQLSEKVGTLVENNERILEIKQGNYGGKLSKYMNVGTSWVLSELSLFLCPRYS